MTNKCRWECCEYINGCRIDPSCEMTGEKYLDAREMKKYWKFCPYCGKPITFDDNEGASDAIKK